MFEGQKWEIPCLEESVYTKPQIRMIGDQISPIQVLFNGAKIDFDKLRAIEGPYEEKGYFPYALFTSFTLHFEPPPEMPNLSKISFKYGCTPLGLKHLKYVLEDLTTLWEQYKTQSITIHNNKRKIQWE